MEKNKNSKQSNYHSQHMSRILAIQSLYAFSMHNSFKTLKLVSNEILKSYKNNELVDDFSFLQSESYDSPDEELFQQLISGYTNSNLQQDELIRKYLKPGWTLEKIDMLLKSILLLAVFELQYFGDFPVKVIIDEYVTITGLFYEKAEIGFINGILDAIAKEIRAIEFKK